MRPHILTLLAAIAALFLAGCQIWQPGGVTAKTGDGAASLTVPSGWMFTTARNVAQGDLLATKDGALLQRVVLSHHEIKEPLAHSKRKLEATQTPFEIADAVLDDLRANREMQALKVIENTPQTVGGHPGFRFVVEYGVADPVGLKLREVHYGALVGARLYQLTFIAPARHYFERDLAAIDKAAQSLQLAAR
ncbi:hypothetical protein [Oleiharenicola sp. Vm1]|uniref:hypothetical protein n=1 Tax=Oleiharenicola sp. Vm1 TaxID=3398393 RepID=UPI0039F63158